MNFIERCSSDVVLQTMLDCMTHLFPTKMETPVDRLSLNLSIGKMDRAISELLLHVKEELDEADWQTMKHHALDMISAGNKILKKYEGRSGEESANMSNESVQSDTRHRGEEQHENDSAMELLMTLTESRYRLSVNKIMGRGTGFFDVRVSGVRWEDAENSWMVVVEVSPVMQAFPLRADVFLEALSHE